jgi:hypothetical protein
MDSVRILQFHLVDLVLSLQQAVDMEENIQLRNKVVRVGQVAEVLPDKPILGQQGPVPPDHLDRDITAALQTKWAAMQAEQEEARARLVVR